MNTDTTKMTGGCGGNCACAGVRDGENDKNECAPESSSVALDEGGKCPCGKVLDDCCHKEDIVANQNDALGELCGPHNGKEVC